jgi:hypothetical protein
MLTAISLQEVSAPEFLDQEIEVKGFLHQMPEGEWVLSSQPNVRSCCTGKKHPKVEVKGEIENPQKAKVVTVQGKLIKKDDHYAIETSSVR